MSKRIQFEYEAKEILEREGWAVLRSAGSRGPVDLFAFNADALWLIQVKSTRRLTARNTVSMLRDAVVDLQGLPLPPNTSRWLWVRALRGGWFRACIDGWPTDRAALRTLLNEQVARWAKEDA